MPIIRTFNKAYVRKYSPLAPKSHAPQNRLSAFHSPHACPRIGSGASGLRFRSLGSFIMFRCSFGLRFSLRLSGFGA